MALPHGSNIKEVIALLEKHNLAEIEIKSDKQTIRVAAHTHAPVQHAQPATITPHQPTQPDNNDTHAAVDLCIRAPLIGTVYLSPSPEEPPFVQPNQSIKKGQTVCLIEVMKTFNHITSTEDAVISEVCVTSGQTVEFDQMLFKLNQS